MHKTIDFCLYRDHTVIYAYAVIVRYGRCTGGLMSAFANGIFGIDN